MWTMIGMEELLYLLDGTEITSSSMFIVNCVALCLALIGVLVLIRPQGEISWRPCDKQQTCIRHRVGFLRDDRGESPLAFCPNTPSGYKAHTYQARHHATFQTGEAGKPSSALRRGPVKKLEEVTFEGRRARDGGANRAGHKRLGGRCDWATSGACGLAASGCIAAAPARDCTAGCSRVMYHSVSLPTVMESISIVDWHLIRSMSSEEAEPNPFAQLATQAWPAE
eukprot:jgi/Botrbrau1/12014/Bobra.247_2s0019.1